MRRNSRELAFKFIYASLFSTQSTFEELVDEQTQPTNEEKDYTLQIINVFNEHKEELEEKIKQNLLKYELHRVYKVDLSLIYLALCEILFLNIQVSVATNEVLELAKIYSTEKSPSFINGIISKIIGGVSGQ